MKAFCLLTVFLLSLTASAQPTSPRPPRGTPGAPSAPAATASDLYQVTDTAIRKDASGLVAWVCASKLTPGVEGSASLVTTPLTQYTSGSATSNLCPTQPFRGQPQAAFCTGVLVTPNVVATSASCLEQAQTVCPCSAQGKTPCDGLFTGTQPGVRAVFGFDMSEAGKPRTSFVAQDVYKPKRIIKQASSAGFSWALIELDRNVTGRTAMPLQQGKTASGQDVLVLGHSLGLPTKVTPTKVLDNNNTPFFTLVPSTAGALPGSPVFNAKTHLVEGFVARDPITWSCANDCCQSTLPPAAGASATVTRSSTFLNAICAPATLCGTACANTLTDPGNCGRCGNACPAGHACTRGKCGCASGSTQCGTTCVDMRTDAQNCGSCGKQCNTPPNTQCYTSTGTCSNGTCGYTPKPAGTVCNDNNASTTSDVCNGSGTCAGTNPCANVTCNSPPNTQCYTSTGTCSNGTCSYTRKATGTTCNDGNASTTGDACTSTGTCVGTNPCANVTCNSPPNTQCYNTTGTCSNGTCSYTRKATGTTCNDGNASTTGDACTSTGTCVGTVVVTNPCANVTCNSPPNPQCYTSPGTCSNGTCSYTLKAAGTACDDGEPDTLDDRCDGSGFCSGSVLTCSTGQTRCGTYCANLKTDVNNCGECGYECTQEHRYPYCRSGVCRQRCEIDPSYPCE
jgi:hypothetical protein